MDVHDYDIVLKFHLFTAKQKNSSEDMLYGTVTNCVALLQKFG